MNLTKIINKFICHAIAFSVQWLSILLVLSMGIGYAGYRLYHDNIPLSWLAPYISQYITDKINADFSFEKVAISYPNFGQHIILDIANIKWEKNSARNAQIQNMRITFKAKDIFQGEFKPDQLIVDDAQIEADINKKTTKNNQQRAVQNTPTNTNDTAPATIQRQEYQLSVNRSDALAIIINDIRAQIEAYADTINEGQIELRNIAINSRLELLKQDLSLPKTNLTAILQKDSRRSVNISGPIKIGEQSGHIIGELSFYKDSDAYLNLEISNFPLVKLLQPALGDSNIIIKRLLLGVGGDGNANAQLNLSLNNSGYVNSVNAGVNFDNVNAQLNISKNNDDWPGNLNIKGLDLANLQKFFAKDKIQPIAGMVDIKTHWDKEISKKINWDITGKNIHIFSRLIDTKNDNKIIENHYHSDHINANGYFESYLKLDGASYLNAEIAGIPISANFIAQPTRQRLSFDMKNAEGTNIYNLWPEHIGRGLRTWLVKNLQKATIKQLDIKWQRQKKDGVWQKTLPKAKFDIADVAMGYLDGLPPMEIDHIYGYSDERSLIFNANQAKIDAFTLSDVKSRIDDIGKKNHLSFKTLLNADLNKLYMTAQQQKHLLDDKIAENIDKINDAYGIADLNIALNFDIRRNMTLKDVNYDVNGNIRDFSIALKQNNLKLSAPNLPIEASRQEIKINGDVILRHDKLPDDLSIKSQLRITPTNHKLLDFTGSGRINGNLFAPYLSKALDREDVKKYLTPNDIILAGNMGYDVNYQFHKNKQHDVSFNIDLNDSLFVLKPIAINKKIAQPASVKLDMQATKDTINASLNINDEQDLSIQAQANFIKNNEQKFTLNTLNMKPFTSSNKINDFDANVEIDKDKNKIITLNARQLNISALVKKLKKDDDKDKEQQDEDAQVEKDKQETQEKIDTPYISVNANINKLIIGDNKLGKNIAINGLYDDEEFQSYAVRGNVNSNVNGDDANNSQFDIAFLPRQFHAYIDDAGAIVNMFSRKKRLTGGQISTKLIRSDDDNPYQGNLEINNFQIVNSPIFLQLLNVISLQGAVRGLQGEGLVFDKTTAQLSYLNKAVDIKNLTASASGIGFTADGNISYKDKTIDLNGKFIPLHDLDRFLDNIPLVGQLITGGKRDGLFALVFDIQGNLRKPKISVNPVESALPPIFRNIIDAARSNNSDNGDNSN